MEFKWCGISKINSYAFECMESIKSKLYENDHRKLTAKLKIDLWTPVAYNHKFLISIKFIRPQNSTVKFSDFPKRDYDFIILLKYTKWLRRNSRKISRSKLEIEFLIAVNKTIECSQNKNPKSKRLWEFRHLKWYCFPLEPSVDTIDIENCVKNYAVLKMWYINWITIHRNCVVVVDAWSRISIWNFKISTKTMWRMKQPTECNRERRWEQEILNTLRICEYIVMQLQFS